MKNVLWFMLIIISIVMLYQGWLVSASGYNLLKLQLADSQLGTKIIMAWKGFQAGDRSLLFIAEANTKLDFLFILVYVIQLITLSNALMQQEKNVFFNELLRLNLLLAVITGLLDVVEDITQLHNFHFYAEPKMYLSTFYISAFKWGLAGWILLVMLISRVKRII